MAGRVALFRQQRQLGSIAAGANSDFPRQLLDLPTVRTRPTARISSEEERIRNGYRITTHYRLPDPADQESARSLTAAGHPPARLTYGPAASVWRINHGWRAPDSGDGFAIDPQTGRWQPQQTPVADPAAPPTPTRMRCPR